MCDGVRVMYGEADKALHHRSVSLCLRVALQPRKQGADKAAVLRHTTAHALNMDHMERTVECNR